MKRGKNYEIVFTTLMYANSASRRYWSEVLDLELYFFLHEEKKLLEFIGATLGRKICMVCMVAKSEHNSVSHLHTVSCAHYPKQSLSVPISSPLLTSAYSQPPFLLALAVFRICVMHIWLLVSPSPPFIQSPKPVLSDSCQADFMEENLTWQQRVKIWINWINI